MCIKQMPRGDNKDDDQVCESYSRVEVQHGGRSTIGEFERSDRMVKEREVRKRMN